MKGNGKTMQRMRLFLKDYFFKDTAEYATKDCGEYTLEHRWNGNANKWEVAIFTKESYGRMEQGKEKYLAQFDNISPEDKHLQEIMKYG